MSGAECSVCWFMQAGVPARPAPPLDPPLSSGRAWAAGHPASSGGGRCMWWAWVQRLQISENSRALGRGDRNRGERLTQCGHRVSAEWAGVPLGGPSSGGWKSETKASVESAPSEAVRVALLQASLPAAGAAGHFLPFLGSSPHHPDFRLRVHVASPCAREPLPLMRMSALLHEGPL